MPTSTQRGFITGNWETKYLERRFKAHKNKIASTKAVIDNSPPVERPHVHYNGKKALKEECRQIWILQQNLRILSRTAEIMNFHNNHVKVKQLQKGNRTRKTDSSGSFYTSVLASNSSSHENAGSKQNIRSSRSISNVLKRNNHIVVQWFLRKFGHYVPWWAQVSY